MTPQQQMEAPLAGLATAGLSNNEIAREAGLSRMSVWRIDNHQFTEPLLSSYMRLGKALERVTGRVPPPLFETTRR